jgi:hypothetical protein
MLAFSIAGAIAILILPRLSAADQEGLPHYFYFTDAQRVIPASSTLRTRRVRAM